MTQTRTHTILALAFALVLSLVPGVAFAAADGLQPADPNWNTVSASAASQNDGKQEPSSVKSLANQCQTSVVDEVAALEALLVDSELASDSHVNKVLSYDPAAIAAIGTQEQSGHDICCPSFSCAYADAVLDGTVNGHEYYTCSCCTWTDWGGGGSFDRCVGSDEQLLREAYDQIAAGRPTVVHVAWGGGEHWITLIGFENADDPDHLTLANFIALDPVDGAQINAASKYDLYGDGCEHISDR